MTNESRSLLSRDVEEELRLPRAPGLFRRFWVKYPVITDIVVAFVCLFLSLVPAGTFSGFSGDTNFWRIAAVDPATATTIIVVATITACVALLFRRRYPLIVFVIALFAETTFLLAPQPVGGPALLVALYSLAVYGSTRSAWIAYGSGAILVSGLSIGFGAANVISGSVGSNAILNAAVFGLIGVLLGVNIGNRRRYLNALIDRSRQLVVERDQQAQLAAAAERTRIAREMHDIVSHSLTVIVALSEGATATSDTERARAATTQVATTARAALTEMRAMLGVLRDPSGGSEGTLAPLTAGSITELVNAAQRAGVPVTLRLTGSEREVPASVQFAVSRTVQESLTNAMRHAPSASRIHIDLEYTPIAVRIDVENDGVPFHVTTGSGGGYGLQGINERLAHVGGRLAVGAAGEGLWRVHALIPLDPTATRAEAK